MKTMDGKPVKRLPGNRPPCQMKEGCDKGTPEHNRNHTPQNQQAYQHYLECVATNDWPRGPDGQIDPIVKRNAVILMEAEQDCKDETWARFRVSALQILTTMRNF